MDRKEARKRGARGRYGRRVVFLEEDEVIGQLEEMAAEKGRSLASEIRGALRYWIQASDDDE